MYPISVSLILAVGLVIFAYTCYRRGVLLSRAPAEKRFDRIGKRLVGLFEFAFGQERILFKDFRSGIFHAFVFWGFSVVSIRTISLFAIGFDANFHLPGFGGTLGDVYNLLKDIFEILVIVGVVALLIRRIIFRPKRLTLSIQADIILVTIFILMITDMFIDGSEIAMHSIIPGKAFYTPAGVFVARLFSIMTLSAQTLKTVFVTSYFIHIVGILAFLNYLPYGKHFHILTSLPNVSLRNLQPYGAIAPMNLEDENATTFGIDKVEQFDWKSVLDFYTCTECGRCQDQCPAYACDKPLSPKDFTVDLRNNLYSINSALMKKDPAEALSKQFTDGRPELLGNIIKKETVWACTTCRACEEACPLFIEYVQKIIDLRRHMVLMQGDVSPEAQTALKNMETNSNPWGISFSERGTWAKDLGIKRLAEDKNVEYLYFVGCAGSFDDRAKKISRAFSTLLQKAGVSFGILGEEEQCTGDSARRLGNEYLFQILAKQNIETFNRYGVKKIITTCPHCYNTIKNEYPQFGGCYEVVHHTELLLSLLKSEKLRVGSEVPAFRRSGEKSSGTQEHKNSETYTFHDSCYLGRYNNIYSAPREILKRLGLNLEEMKNSKELGRCCGAGGGWMWMEDTEGTRINHKRLEDVEETSANSVASACPFCLTMLDDATKDKKLEDKYAIKDIAEILLERCDNS